LVIAAVQLLTLPHAVQGFDNDELEIFDLVEEVNQNFYQFLELEQTATTSEIKKAYRKLSLVLHPDKNDADDAELKFRWLASIYDILRDSKKREIYDRVLVEGLPNWKSPVFYYRRMRKIGLLEGLAYLTVIASFIQYAMHWAAYYERKFTLEGNLGDQLNKRSTIKRMKKAANKSDFDPEKILNDHLDNLGVVQPSVYDLLPFQVMRLGKATVLALPTLPSVIYTAVKEHREAQEALRKAEKEEEEEMERREQEKKDRKEKLRQRKLNNKPKYEEREERYNKSNDQAVTSSVADVAPPPPRNARKLWTDDQLAKLCRLMKKYPGGTQDRWETIADVMERYPWEITKMAANVKGSMFMAPSQTAGNKVPGLDAAANQQQQEDTATDDSEEESDSQDDSEDDDDDSSDNSSEIGYTMASKNDYVPVQVKTKTKTRKAPTTADNNANNPAAAAEADSTSTEASDSSSWSQSQQKCLEEAIKSIAKGTPERWDRIAQKVEGKTAEDCIQRFKYLAQMVKAKKASM